MWPALGAGRRGRGSRRDRTLSTGAGVVDTEDLPEGWIIASPQTMHVVRVTEPVVATSMDFRFADAYTGLEIIPKAGTVIGWSEGEAVRTPYDNCMLVMPSVRQLRPGVTVVRFGRIEQSLENRG